MDEMILLLKNLCRASAWFCEELKQFFTTNRHILKKPIPNGFSLRGELSLIYPEKTLMLFAMAGDVFGIEEDGKIVSFLGSIFENTFCPAEIKPLIIEGILSMVTREKCTPDFIEAGCKFVERVKKQGKNPATLIGFPKEAFVYDLTVVTSVALRLHLGLWKIEGDRYVDLALNKAIL